MKRFFCAFFFVVASAASAAIAPDSLAGKVYRDAFQQRTGPSYGYGERTIALRADGRFVFIKHAPDVPLGVPPVTTVYLQGPRGDGVYTYTRSGENRGDLRLAFDDGTLDVIGLEFTTPTEGRSLFATLSLTFWLSDAGALGNAPVSNLSLRGRATPGRPLIAGFVVPGTAPAEMFTFPPSGAGQREMLIRVVGPSLAPLGVADTWSDPDFKLYRGASPSAHHEAHYGDWSVPPPEANLNPAPALRKIFDQVGAFPLLPGSKDAVDVVRLPPGAYSIVCNPPAGDPGGEVLIEVYFLP